MVRFHIQQTPVSFRLLKVENTASRAMYFATEKGMLVRGYTLNNFLKFPTFHSNGFNCRPSLRILAYSSLFTHAAYHST